MAKPPFDWRRTPGLGLLTVLVLAFFYAPLCILVAFSFNAGAQATLWRGFSIKWFGVVLQNHDIGAALRNSLIVAVSAMCLSSVLALTAALGLRGRLSPRGRSLTLGLILSPLVVPEISIAIATLMFFSALGLRLGLGNLIIAHTIFCIPFVFLPIQARLLSLGNSLEEAGRDLYANAWLVFRRVTLPLLAPSILAGALLAFASSLDDFIISMMLANAGQTTLPVYIYGMLRFGVTPEVNAISTLLLFSSTLIVTVAFAGLQFRQGRKSASRAA